MGSEKADGDPILPDSRREAALVPVMPRGFHAQYRLHRKPFKPAQPLEGVLDLGPLCLQLGGIGHMLQGAAPAPGIGRAGGFLPVGAAGQYLQQLGHPIAPVGLDHMAPHRFPGQRPLHEYGIPAHAPYPPAVCRQAVDG